MCPLPPPLLLYYALQCEPDGRSILIQYRTEGEPPPLAEIPCTRLSGYNPGIINLWTAAAF